MLIEKYKIVYKYYNIFLQSQTKAEKKEIKLDHSATKKDDQKNETVNKLDSEKDKNKQEKLKKKKMKKEKKKKVLYPVFYHILHKKFALLELCLFHAMQ